MEPTRETNQQRLASVTDRDRTRVPKDKTTRETDPRSVAVQLKDKAE
jgi:hypothetical protein